MNVGTAAARAASPAGPGRPRTSSSPVRYAVVGLGHIAQAAVLPAFTHLRNSKLAALVSGDPQKLKQLGGKYRGVRTYGYDQFEACLAEAEIDAVYLALPNDLHYDFACRAIAAGKHVLCEKPLATTLTDAKRMYRQATQQKVQLMTAYRLHFEPATLASLKLVRSGEIGEPRYFNASFSYQLTDTGNIRLRADHAGGPIFDIGVYCINAARVFLGDEPTEVAAFLTRSEDPRFKEVEETAAVILRFPRGRVAAFTVSFGAESMSRLEVVGTKGAMVLDPAFEYSEPLRQRVTASGKTRTKTFVPTDQFAGEIAAFSRCISTGTTPEASGEEGIADLRVIEAIFHSASTGRPVKLGPFQRKDQPEGRQVTRKPPVRAPKPGVRVQSPHD